MTATTLVDLLGDTRSQMVEALRGRTATTAELAEELGVSEAAVRKQLRLLTSDGLVRSEAAEPVGRGRPAARHALTERARHLYPDRSADLANDLFGYLEAEHGRAALRGFLRWRQEQQVTAYEDVLEEIDDPAERLDRLAELLSADGFLATCGSLEAPEGKVVLELRQGHCAIADVAAAHPELCAFEAALFQRLLGGKISRRTTIAAGHEACVATVTHDLPPA